MPYTDVLSSYQTFSRNLIAGDEAQGEQPSPDLVRQLAAAVTALGGGAGGGGSSITEAEISSAIDEATTIGSMQINLGYISANSAETVNKLVDLLSQVAAIALNTDAVETQLTKVSAGATNLTFAPLGSHTAQGSLGSIVTLSPLTNATKLLIQARIADIRYTLDGTNPVSGDSGVGFVLHAGQPPLTIPIAGATIKILEESVGARVQYQWGT